MRPALLSPLFALIVAGAALAASGASAQEQLSEPELSELRGGFLIVDGQALDFSAIVRSYVDGQMVLESRLSWTDHGAVVEHAGQAATPEMLTALTGAGISLPDISGAGVFVSPDGQTAFIHRAEDGQIANLLINVANGQDFRQETSLNLVLPGFEATQTAMRDVMVARALAADIINTVRPGQ